MEQPEVKPVEEIDEKAKAEIERKEYEKMKANRWAAFIEYYKDRIKTIPTIGGRKVIPCAWDNRTHEWFWMTRDARRNAMKRAKKMGKKLKFNKASA